MAVIKVIELANREASLNNARLATYRRNFQVVTDTKRDGPIAVRAGFGTATGIGLYSAYNNGMTGTVAGVTVAVPFHEADPTSYVRDVTCNCISADGLNWMLAADYGPYDPVQHVDNPLNAPPEVSWDGVTWEELCDQDVHGNPILNTAGDPFDPPITREDSRPVLRITRNEPIFSAGNAHTWRNRLNSDTFMGCVAGIAKLRPIKAARQYHPTAGYFWVVNYEFEFNPQGWKKTILNQGLRQRTSSGTAPSITYGRAAIRIAGEPATAPVPLDSTGLPVAPGGAVDFLTFDIYEAVPFAPLNLDPGGNLGNGSPANFGGAANFAGAGFTGNGAPAGGIPAAPPEDGGTEG